MITDNLTVEECLDRSKHLIEYAESTIKEQPSKSTELLINQLGEHLKLFKRALTSHKL